MKYAPWYLIVTRILLFPIAATAAFLLWCCFRLGGDKYLADELKSMFL